MKNTDNASRETVEEFLSRGGVIEHVPSYVMKRESAKKLTQKEHRDKERTRGVALRRGTFSDLKAMGVDNE